jgi:hypothetical protein
MKPIYKHLACVGLSVISMAVFAGAVEPVISHNVHVVKNATPAQCNASWEGDIAPASAVDDTGAGSQTILTAPGVRSCSSCAIEQASGDCVCKTCYDNYNE